ncbi:hypothetical protein BZG36_00993 [Bifiguratus adelaidae]|uniref:CobW/HypB/UreG nucleotide-binding domain-containing protein n=1 Tax=Bifiguratus adelaidae TaxID=1938954 RepID=A0A261Y697_9FUNG|nr:hypothetical protein BZG36_00993 [Bifiguratus adelaidae]
MSTDSNQLATAPPSKTPITVFTGFLGSGKTTIILSLLKRVPKGYKLCLLKNEFGDVEVDSELARESNVDVQEMLNGCLCCVLVGQMKLALEELKAKYNPDRIIVETSGSAFPAPIAWQIRQIEDEGFQLDSIITVIDCVNFSGYEDTSYTARMQAQYTDVILLNKHELISEREFDLVLDHVNELNIDTPKLKCDATKGVSPDLIFGIDTRLFQLQFDKTHVIDEFISKERADGKVIVSKPGQTDFPHHPGDGGEHFDNEVDLIQVIVPNEPSRAFLSRTVFKEFLASLPKDDVYRVKGFIRLSEGGEPAGTQMASQPSASTLYIVNHAFGRHTPTEVTHPATLEKARDINVRLTVMGQDLRLYVDRVKQGLHAESQHVKWTPAQRH